MALLLGVVLASAFFAGIDIKTNVTAMQALDQQLRNVYVDMDAYMYGLNSTQMFAARNSVLSLAGVVDAEIISRSYSTYAKIFHDNNSISAVTDVAAITDDSRVYDGWLNRPAEKIGENETYIPENSALASLVQIGDTIQLNFSIPYIESQLPVINLTVKGFAQLNDAATAIASGSRYSIMPYPTGNSATQTGPLLLVNWETVQKILDAHLSYLPIETHLLIYLNREALINPWDITTSINNIAVMENSIVNRIHNVGLSLNVQNNLQEPLLSFQYISTNIRFSFTLVSLPIFFVAWYMGTTVADVSFNLRRREIGLLSTKGFSRGQILRMFLTETFLIGCIGGAIGIFLGFILNPLFTQFSTEALFNPQVISPYTIVLTIAFGVILAFLSTYSSAKAASRLPTVDALREYLPTETEKLSKMRLPLLALILGTYKIGVFISGINMSDMLSRMIFNSGNFIVSLLIGIFFFIDIVLNYIGPLLFFWGFTKLFIQGSLEFQQLVTRTARFLGDLGALATKNVRRNPARAAAIAFLIALIVGYTVQVNGQLASERDYVVRQTYCQVGADIAVNIVNADETPEILNSIMANVSGLVQNLTTEYSFVTYPAGTSMLIEAVEPHSWLKTAYYESDWFSGIDVTTAFNNLAVDKNTIILERRIADAFNLEIGQNISLTFGSSSRNLRVVGFFGPEILQTYGPTYWSFVSKDFYDEISGEVSASAKIFLKLKGGVNGKTVADNIRNLNLNIDSVESIAEELANAQTDIVTMGTLDVQRLGIVFAFLGASVGTALISIVSMKERSREAAIMSVKGLSYKQLIIMFLTENLALVIFSVVLGLFVGFVAAYGNISATNATLVGLVRRRLVFPLDSTLMLTSCLALIFAATVLPILIMLRGYVTNLERMVRMR
ncbi:MAG TPA: FtsX-like permease family protein [Acidobacteriota bacterium]|nr:FtsX-like permease family protein [Acidobacteriota bacterium]